jgi:hypothetical protein
MDDKNKMTVFRYDTSATTYYNLSKEAYEYQRDTLAIPLETADFLYMGRRKPFYAIYADVNASYPNAVSCTLTAEYYNGTAWTALTLAVEDTKGFERSGFIKWEAPTDANGDEVWESVTINSADKYFVRLIVSANLTSTTKLNGLNIIFADDEDLKREDYNILALLPEDADEVAATSHILTHVASREFIVDHIKRSGKVKTDSVTGDIVDTDEWDLLEVNQVRQASVFKSLSKIYFAASDNPEDIYWKKYEQYERLYTDAIGLYLLTLDTNDDGVASASEKASIMAGGIFTRR